MRIVQEDRHFVATRPNQLGWTISARAPSSPSSRRPRATHCRLGVELRTDFASMRLTASNRRGDGAGDLVDQFRVRYTERLRAGSCRQSRRAYDRRNNQVPRIRRRGPSTRSIRHAPPGSTPGCEITSRRRSEERYYGRLHLTHVCALRARFLHRTPIRRTATASAADALHGPATTSTRARRAFEPGRVSGDRGTRVP